MTGPTGGETTGPVPAAREGEGEGERERAQDVRERARAGSALAERLRPVVPGSGLVLPSSPEYDAARPVYNRMFDDRPAALVRSLDETVLRRAVAAAATLGLPIAVRGGGHHIGGFSTVDGGLVVDFSTFRAVELEPGTGIVRVRPGARLGDVDAYLAARGRCLPSGTVSDTGITGLTLGGGIGWLVAGHGLTCDHLHEARVLLADGRVLRVSRESHSDLFLALRGGGVGAFGIILELRYRTVPLPRIVAGSVRFGGQEAAGVLRRLQRLLAGGAPTAVTLAAVLSRGERGPELSVDLCCQGDHAQESAAVREAIGGDWSDVVERDYPRWQSHFDAAFLPPMRGYWTSVHFDHLALDPEALVEALRAAPTRACTALVEYFNPGTLRRHAEGSAYPLRDSRMAVLLSARWPDPAGDEAHRAWGRRWAAALRAAGGAKAYSNYSGASDAGMRATYRTGVLDAVRRLAAAYDPGHLFARGHRAALTGGAPRAASGTGFPPEL